MARVVIAMVAGFIWSLTGAGRWIERVTVKGAKNATGAPLRTYLGLRGADVVTLYARESALEDRHMPIDSIWQPEILRCLLPIWTEKHETAKRVVQRLKTGLDVAKRSGENPTTTVQEANVLPKVRKAPEHHSAMPWQRIPGFYTQF